MAHNNMGVIYMNEGKLDEAALEYQAELKNNPYYDNSLFNLGLVDFRQGKTDEAVKLWEETISVNPDYTDAYKNLIAYYQQKGNQEKMNEYIQILYQRGLISQ